ncbi:GNAT family N-acetyltransferase [Facilibium subflavum]|uniref:GNAT family N-acetyltransferase n=1 Tax=Facilibium subflavum TaxID=2219058 RepID=UPI000E647BDB|nr:GNAT family protein [Facilibium subflavum]
MTEKTKSIYTLKQIETPRLIIRPVRLGDEIEINKAINNSLEILQKWQPWAKDPSIDATRTFVQRGMFSWESGCIKDFPMVVIHKQDKRIIGASGYNDRSDPDDGLYEIGYWCDVDYQGQGLVTEYANALTRFAFDVLSAHKVVISMQIENKKSSAVAIRLNFSNEGTIDRDSVDCTPKHLAQHYIYSTNNIKKLPALDYSWSSDKSKPSGFHIINWAKDILKITDNKAFAMSQAITKTPWSHVFEINTGNEVFYLKKIPEMFSKEAKFIQFLEKNSNASLPQIIAENSKLNCFLMKNAGQTLRETLNQNFSEELVFRTIDQFTCLQNDMANHVNTLLRMGVPDYRLEKMPDLYTQLIQQKNLLKACSLSEIEIKKLSDLTSTVSKLCKKLAEFQIIETIVQPDFNDNNTLVDETNQRITIIDLGEIVISHPFFSLINFLYQMKKHHGLSEEDDLYHRLKAACFNNYQPYFTSDRDFEDALATSKIVNIVYGLVDQDRFIRACGIDNLIKHEYWKLTDLLKTFMATCKNNT